MKTVTITVNDGSRFKVGTRYELAAKDGRRCEVICIEVDGDDVTFKMVEVAQA